MTSPLDGDNPAHSFHDLPAAAFPVTMKAYGVHSGKVLWWVSVDRPAAVEVPPLAKQHGEPVRVVVHYADGGSDDVGCESDDG